jgi:hypothetical protein
MKFGGGGEAPTHFDLCATAVFSNHVPLQMRSKSLGKVLALLAGRPGSVELCQILLSLRHCRRGVSIWWQNDSADDCTPSSGPGCHYTDMLVITGIRCDEARNPLN